MGSDLQPCMVAATAIGKFVSRYKYEQLINNNYSGTIKPTSPTMGSDATNNSTRNECHTSSTSSGELRCQGNANQYCGSSTASDVYEDTSFPDVALATQGGNYAYVGCFTVVSPGDLFYATTASNTAACQSTCANLGYPFAGMSNQGGVTGACQCGTEIQKGQKASGTQTCRPCGAGDTGISCGGRVGGSSTGAPLITIYRNINLQGCYKPRVPGETITTTTTTTSKAPASTSSTILTSTSSSSSPISTASSSVSTDGAAATATSPVVARDTTIVRTDGR